MLHLRQNHSSKGSSLRRALWTNTAIAIMVGCGTVTGNPGSGGKSSFITLPYIDFSIPTEWEEALSLQPGLSLNLKENRASKDGLAFNLRSGKRHRRDKPGFKDSRNCKANLECLTQRITLNIESVEQVLKQLEQEGLSEGTFENKGPGQDLYGSVRRSDQDESFYEATICHQGWPLMHIKWNEDNQLLEAYRSHKTAPLEVVNTENRITKIRYQESAEETLVEISTQGKNHGVVKENRDGSYLFESVKAIKKGDKTSISAVGNWTPEYETQTQEGDEYLVASISVDQSRYISYNKSRPGCSHDFDENADDIFGGQNTEQFWCVARDLITKQTFRPDDSKFTEIVQSLSEIGIQPSTSLQSITFPDSAINSCKKEE